MATVDTRLILVSVHCFQMLGIIVRKIKLMSFYFPEENMLNFINVVGL